MEVSLNVLIEKMSKDSIPLLNKSLVRVQTTLFNLARIWKRKSMLKTFFPLILQLNQFYISQMFNARNYLGNLLMLNQSLMIKFKHSTKIIRCNVNVGKRHYIPVAEIR